MFNESDKAGIGVVIRNATGEIIAALSEKILKPASVAQVAGSKKSSQICPRNWSSSISF